MQELRTIEKLKEDLLHSQATRSEENRSEKPSENQPIVSEKKRKASDFKRKIFLHGVLCFTMFNIGWSSGIQGPVFEDLMTITGVSTGEGSVFVAVWNGGKLIGSVACGLLIDRYNKALVMVGGTFCAGCFNFVIPLCTMYWLMILVYGMYGIGLGVLITGSLVTCGQLWKAVKSSRSSMQLMLLCMPVGAMLAPLVAAPFLSSDVTEGISNNLTQKALNETTDLYSTEQDDHIVTPPFITDGRTHANVTEVMYRMQRFKPHRLIIPFSISGSLLGFATIMYLGVYCCNPQSKADEKEHRQIQINDAENGRPLTLTLRVLRLYLVGQFTFVNKGIEQSFTQFLPTCLHSRMGWNKVVSSDIMSVYWGPLAFTRVIGIGISYYIRSSFHLFWDIVFLLISEVILLIGLYGYHDSLMWVSCAAMGISVATVTPCFISWMQTEILSTGGTHNSYYMVMTSLGESLFPLIIGNLVAIDYMYFPGVLLGAVCVLLVNHFCLFVLARTKLNPGRR